MDVGIFKYRFVGAREDMDIEQDTFACRLDGFMLAQLKLNWPMAWLCVTAQIKLSGGL
jgi:hypothetical protein